MSCGSGVAAKYSLQRIWVEILCNEDLGAIWAVFVATGREFTCDQFPVASFQFSVFVYVFILAS
jgi:hypothetical protein